MLFKLQQQESLHFYLPAIVYLYMYGPTLENSENVFSILTPKSKVFKDGQPVSIGCLSILITIIITLVSVFSHKINQGHFGWQRHSMHSFDMISQVTECYGSAPSLFALFSKGVEKNFVTMKAALSCEN
uniref:Uncharacterized protein n=1 Tax=Glossina austeni TaxID=7395 RepID=A0A1A9UKY1_GLOAU